MLKHNIGGYSLYKIDDVRDYLRSKNGSKEVDSFDKFIKFRPGIDTGKSFYIFVKDYLEWENAGIIRE